ncbi:hypothetical protein JTM12_36400, partial [Pseudomonas aeruginosa]|nr:hypothetical protein [Pseudomonas aeruginosa]
LSRRGARLQPGSAASETAVNSWRVAAADNGNFQCLHSVLFSDFRHTERRARSPGPHVMMMKNGMRKLVFEQG